MSGANRHRKPARRAAFEDPKPIILVVCEGEVTEKQYREQFARHHKNARVQVRVAPETGVPLTIVTAAKKYRDLSKKSARRERASNLEYDAVWCVFDIDEHPHIPEAFKLARENQIDLAVSNPCFELWLLLHFLDDAPGMNDRKVFKTLLAEHVPGYVKSVDFRRFADRYASARELAGKLDKLAESMSEPGRNPTTGVYRLTESILGRPDSTRE